MITAATYSGILNVLWLIIIFVSVASLIAHLFNIPKMGWSCIMSAVLLLVYAAMLALRPKIIKMERLI